MDNFLKQMAQLRTDFRDVQQKIDAKVDHMLEMLASMQLQLQMQGMTKGEEIGDDFSFAEPQLHNLPYLSFPIPQKIGGESEILPPNQQLSPMNNNWNDGQLESEGFGEVLNHPPIITTVAKEADLFIEETTQMKAHKVFDEMLEPEMKIVCMSEMLGMKLDSGAEENEDNDESIKEVYDSSFVTCYEESVKDPNSYVSVFWKLSNIDDESKIMVDYVEQVVAHVMRKCVGVASKSLVKNKSNETTWSFDPGGDSRVFGECSYKKLFYIEELVLLLSCLNSPRNHSKSYKPKYFGEEVILRFDVTYLHRSLLRVKATRRPHERNTRLENMCRRIRNLAWRKKQLGAEESQRKKKWHLERERGWREAGANISNLYDGETGDVPGEIIFHSENNRDRLSKINSVEMMEAWANKKMGEKLCIIFISLHGLIRGENLELRSDSDIGGLVKYVVKLARALGSMPGVHRVDLLTIQVSSPEVDWSYGEPREMLPPRNSERLGDEMGENSSAHIVRIPLGPKDRIIPNELLWSHIYEFVDGVLNHTIHVSKDLGEQIGNGHPVWSVVIHGRYADEGDFGSFLYGILYVPMFLTCHSLDRDKLEQLLRQGRQLRIEINSNYKVMRKIGREELFLDAYKVVSTSTKQEIEESDERSSNFQQNDKRHRYQNLVHGISIQVLQELPFVIRSTCETTSQIFEDNHFDILLSYKWWKDGSMSWTILLKEYIIDENRGIMKSFLEEMLKTLRYTNNFNVMVDGYVKLGDMRLAKWLFNMMHDWKLYSWNLMFVEYCQNKQSHEVIELLEQLSLSKMLELNGITIVVVFPTLTDFGDSIYRYVKKKILDKYLEVLLLIVVGVMNVSSSVSTGKKGIAVSMFDQLLSKPQPQFRHLSRGDTTLSKGEYCCGNGARLEGRVGGDGDGDGAGRWWR